MNTVLTLYDIEFRKIKNVYFSIIGLLSVSNLLVFIHNFYMILKEVEKTLNVSGNISLLSHYEFLNILKSREVVFQIYSITFMLMCLAIIWCLYYSFHIWYRDFYGKTKSIYTLFMLPSNKFNVYLSKLITIISLIYGIIITQYILWVIQIFVINIITKIPINNMIDIIGFNKDSINLLGVSIFPMEFLVIYILAPILIVTIIFTAIMIHKSFNKIGTLVGITYIGVTVITFLYAYTYNYMYSDEVLIFVLGFYSISFLISIFISYMLINKKVYI